MTNYPWSSLIRISPFRSILWNIFFLLSHSLTYEMLPTGPWIDRQKCFSHRRANQTTDFSTCESVPTTCPRIASYWEDKMMGVMHIYVWVLSGIRASAIRNDVTDWITHRDISGQCHPIPKYQFWSQTDCKKHIFYFGLPKMSFCPPTVIATVFDFADSFVTLPSHGCICWKLCYGVIYLKTVIKMQAYHPIQSPSATILYSPFRSPPCPTVSAASSQPASNQVVFEFLFFLNQIVSVILFLLVKLSMKFFLQIFGRRYY